MHICPFSPLLNQPVAILVTDFSKLIKVTNDNIIIIIIIRYILSKS